MARLLLAVLLESLRMGGAFAAVDTFVPAEDSVVVETLRTRPLERADVESRVLRATLRTRRGDAATASAVAQRAIVLARRDGDPRYLGYAQAALQELDRVVAQNPAAGQAWLTRALILQVQGRYRLAELADRADHAVEAALGLGDEASRSEAALAARFAAARLRGDRVHQREEARFELQLRRRPDAAVALALENWAVQKEPVAARLLLESARAAARRGPQAQRQLSRALSGRRTG